MHGLQSACRLGSLGLCLALTSTAAAQPSGESKDGAASAQGARAGDAGLERPRLVQFEPAAYPPGALAAGLTADVLLRLTIDVDGAVTAAEPVEAVGNGFDEAAVQAARRFKFTPALRDGKAVAVQILYRYSFTLNEAASGDEEQQVAAPSGELRGQVLMAATDLAVPLAKVVVRGGGLEQPVELVAAENGRWKLPSLPVGRYLVEITAEGFSPFTSEEDVAEGELTLVTYRLAPTEGALEVTVVGERPPREVTRRTLSRREISRVPGTSGDALRSIQSLPGVARPPGLAGLLIVRGSAPQDTLTFIDGGFVPIIYHFGGLSSVVPTELLERIDFYPGNFSARYGQAMGGIVDVALGKPDTSCTGDYGAPSDERGCYRGLLQADLIDNRVLVSGPIANSKSWSFALGARRSWVDVWLKPVLEEAGASVTTAPVYHDYQLIVHNQVDEDTELRLQAYGSDDALRLVIENPATEDPGFGGNLTLTTSFYRLQAIYKDQISPEVSQEVMLAVGRNQLGFSLGPFLFKLEARPVLFRSEFGFRLGEGLKLNVGADLAAFPFDVTVRAPPPPRPGEPDPGPFAARPPLETRQKRPGFRPGWYTELEWQASQRLRLVPGVRLDYARDSGSEDVSPRLTARYDLTGKEPEASPTALKAGVGVFHQPPQFQETDPVFGTPGLESNRAIHYSLGVERRLFDRVDASVEGFFKDLSNLVSRAPDSSGTFRYANEREGSAMGLEALLKYRADARFLGWVAYTLSRSVFRDQPGGPERKFDFDQTHNLTMLGSYQLGSGWEFGARFRLISGSLTTPVLEEGLPALYAADAGAYTPLSGAPASRRLPPFHQLDVRIDKRWQFRVWRLSAYLDVQNAYNHQAAEALLYNYNYSQESYQTGLPVIPSLGLRGEL